MSEVQVFEGDGTQRDRYAFARNAAYGLIGTIMDLSLTELEGWQATCQRLQGDVDVRKEVWVITDLDILHTLTYIDHGSTAISVKLSQIRPLILAVKKEWINAC